MWTDFSPFRQENAALVGVRRLVWLVSGYLCSPGYQIDLLTNTLIDLGACMVICHRGGIHHTTL